MISNYTPGEVAMRGDIVDRLRGKYPVGPHLPNGNPEFGWRQFEATPINLEAAAEIEQLRRDLGKATVFTIGRTPLMERWITVERRNFSAGFEREEGCWAVVRDGFWFTKNGEWEAPSLPSSRTDDFYERATHSLTDAMTLANEMVTTGPADEEPYRKILAQRKEAADGR